MKNRTLFGESIGFYEDHWVGMPEFVQEKQEPFSKIIIRLENEQDLADLSELLGQKLTKKTKSIWHPHKSHWGARRYRYVDDK